MLMEKQCCLEKKPLKKSMAPLQDSFENNKVVIGVPLIE